MLVYLPESEKGNVSAAVIMVNLLADSAADHSTTKGTQQKAWRIFLHAFYPRNDWNQALTGEDILAQWRPMAS